MRETIHTLLTTDPAFNAIVAPELLFAGGAVPDAPGAFPFGIERWGPSTKELGPAYSQTFALWIYDDAGDYLRIGDALRAARARLSTIDQSGARTVNNTGVIMGVHYLGSSGDLYDQGYHALVQNASWRIVATGE